MSYLENAEKQELLNLLNKDDTEILESFQNYIVDLVNKKQTNKKYNIKQISRLVSPNDKAFNRFPLLTSKYLCKLCLMFKLTAEEAFYLYEHAGRHMHLADDFELVKHFSKEETKEYVCTESYIDCWLRLVKEHNYTEFGDINECDQELIDFSQNKLADISNLNLEDKQKLLKELYKIIKFQSEWNNWAIQKIDEKFFRETKHCRETIFEFAYVCELNLKETIQLYNAFGLSLNSSNIKFDAFVSFLHKYKPILAERMGLSIKESSMYFYKEVCSTINEDKFIATSPNPEIIQELTDIEYGLSETEYREIICGDRVRD